MTRGSKGGGFDPLAIYRDALFDGAIKRFTIVFNKQYNLARRPFELSDNKIS
jgi:hypothetical protein